MVHLQQQYLAMTATTNTTIRTRGMSRTRAAKPVRFDSDSTPLFPGLVFPAFCGEQSALIEIIFGHVTCAHACFQIHIYYHNYYEELLCLRLHFQPKHISHRSHQTSLVYIFCTCPNRSLGLYLLLEGLTQPLFPSGRF